VDRCRCLRSGIGTLIVSVVAIHASLLGVRDQLRTSVFVAYTERYFKILVRLPFDARRPGSDYRLEDVSQAERTVVLSVFREYFNLCSEELWLFSTERIDKATWEAWRLGMKDTARFRCFNEAWQYLAGEYSIYEQFWKFMNELTETQEESGMATRADPRPEHPRAGASELTDGIPSE
jgi:hypothetical protein